MSVTAASAVSALSLKVVPLEGGQVNGELEKPRFGFMADDG